VIFLYGAAPDSAEPGVVPGLITGETTPGWLA
jgi:hypothetical protein